MAELSITLEDCTERQLRTLRHHSLTVQMALFGPRFDLEAGEPVPAAWNGSLQPGNPPVLRHRAQASQRFIVGKACSSGFGLNHLEKPLIET